MNKDHINGLDTCRAIAAFVVLVQHIELFKGQYNLSNFLGLPFFRYTGGYVAVIMFFTLSGFLITLLLLKEREKHNCINLKKFYLRRILRVWPLYYFIILISYLLIDYDPSTQTLLLCLTIFPNIALATGASWIASPQIWSIGIEEQFYLVWPHLVKKVNKIRPFAISLIIFLTVFPHLLLFIWVRVSPDSTYISLLNKLFYGMKFNCMAIGGFAAVLFIEKSRIIKWFNKSLSISYSLILIPFILWFLGVHFIQFTADIYAILFAISILIIASNQHTISIDTPVLKFLGKISYGVYMYHWLVLEFIFRIDLSKIENDLNYNALVYLLTIMLTTLIASLSYYFFELPFLKAKEKFNTQ